MSTIQIDRLLDTIVRNGASDLHISIGRPPTIRLHGKLKSLATKVLESDDCTALMKSITPEKNQQELAEVGGTDFGFAFGSAARFRASIFRQRGDISMVLRLIPNKLLTFAEIGLPTIVQDLCRRPRGLFLVTGPTGSGKTTTLYSSIRQMDTRKLNVSTVEDPVEYNLSGITQIQTHERIGMTFAKALKALLRQDPDVIMVGEIRDAETAQTAIQAALTGHLVLSTLHTNDAPSSITRLINIGVEPFLVGAALHSVLAQRLVRKICPNCATEKPIPEHMEEVLSMYGIFGNMKVGAGCNACRQTGHAGRLGLYELLVLDDFLRDKVITSPNVVEFRRLCIERGMITLRDDGFAKVKQGRTTVEDVLRVTEATA